MANQKKVLVTGGTGFIGSHTVVELQKAGYEVVVIDNLAQSYRFVIDQIAAITGVEPAFYPIDLCDQTALKKFFEENQDLEAVVHFAAYKSVGESVNQPLKYYHNNLVSLINLLELMKTYQVKDLVFSSSCTVYGEPDQVPVAEDAPIKKAESPYGNTKHIGEDILHESSSADNLEVISLRYFNPIGAHDSALIGELPIGTPENLMPYLAQTASGRREQLTVFGNDYPTPDGTCIRDYIHVVDLADAHVVALNRLQNKGNKDDFEVFNLGTGEGYSVFDIIQAFENATGIKIDYEIGERRKGDVTQVYADTTKANRDLGWQTQYSLEDMMATAWNWEQTLKEMDVESA